MWAPNAHTSSRRRYGSRHALASDCPATFTERRWMLLSETSESDQLDSIQHVKPRVSEVSRAKFWLHSLHGGVIAAAHRDLILPTSPTKRLVNHVPSQDIIEH